MAASLNNTPEYMNENNTKNFILGVLFFLVPVYTFLTWIYAFQAGSDHASRLDIYDNFFPAFLHDPFAITVVNILCAALAIVFLKKMQHLSKPVTVLTYGMMILSGFFILFNLWGLL